MQNMKMRFQEVRDFSAKREKDFRQKYASYFGMENGENLYLLFTENFYLRSGGGKRSRCAGKLVLMSMILRRLHIFTRGSKTDPVREASHVVIDEAQDFGMMSYRCLHYCLYGCTYTIMGDTSQNIHFEYG